MCNSKLLKYGLYRLVPCTAVKSLPKKSWSELFKKHQINLSWSTPSTVVNGDSIALRLARVSDGSHTFFRNVLNLNLGVIY